MLKHCTPFLCSVSQRSNLLKPTDRFVVPQSGTPRDDNYTSARLVDLPASGKSAGATTIAATTFIGGTEALTPAGSCKRGKLFFDSVMAALRTR
jgi:hypothetical protein